MVSRLIDEIRQKSSLTCKRARDVWIRGVSWVGKRPLSICSSTLRTRSQRRSSCTRWCKGTETGWHPGLTIPLCSFDDTRTCDAALSNPAEASGVRRGGSDYALRD